MESDLVVYRAWPEEVIADAVREFNDYMHDGADVGELYAGLRGLDFLTRKSSLSDNLQARVDGAIVEAHMRIELLCAKELEDRSIEEQYTQILRAVTILDKQLASIHRQYIDPGQYTDDEVTEIIRRRVDRRMSS